MTSGKTETLSIEQSGQPHRVTPLVVFVAVFCLSLLSYLHAAHQHGILWSPPTNGGDEDGYERLGYNLAAGLGFGYCPCDHPVLTGEAEPPVVERCEPNCNPDDFVPTAYRPPGFPFLIAALDLIAPLNFPLIRIINCIFCAAGVAIVAMFLARHGQTAPALLMGLTCSIDPRLREFAGTFLTENMATLACSLFAVSLALFLERKDRPSAALCGVALTSLVFIRSFYVAWYPAIWILIAVILFRKRRSGINSRTWIVTLTVFCLASLALTLPWWIRNCVVLDSLMPTGTQGGIGIADGFSDTAWDAHGSWTSQTANQIGAEIRQDPSTENLQGIEFEKEHCKRGSAAAVTWIRQHPDKLPMLTWWKLSRLWEAESRWHPFLFAAMAIGLFVGRRNALAKVTLLLLLLNSLTVMATYHTYERFLTPLRPVIHAFAAMGILPVFYCLQRFMTRFRK
jgi:4-amino-4-deoxy-L-arabinose transferase-like glycosyltransferase